MALPNFPGPDSLRGFVARNTPQTLTVDTNGNVSRPGQTLRIGGPATPAPGTSLVPVGPGRPMTPPTVTPMTPDMPGYHGDGRYGAPVNGDPNASIPKPAPMGNPVAGQAPGGSGASPGGGQPNGVAGLKPDYAANPAKPFEFDPNVKASEGPSLRQRVTDLFSKGKPAPTGPAPYSAGAMVQVAKPFLGPAAIAGTMYDEQKKVAQVAADPNTSKLDVATQQAEGLGRWGAAGAAGLAAATAATPSAPFTMGLGPLVAGAAGSVAGYYGADGAIKAGRMLTGGNAQSPVDQLRTPAASGAPAAPSNGTRLPDTGAGAGRGRIVPPGTPNAAPNNMDPRSRDFSAELNKVPAELPADLREGVVHKTIDPVTGRVTYSGRNVAAGADGNTQFVDGTGRNLTPRGSLRTVHGMPTMGAGGYASDDSVSPEAKQAMIDKTLTNPDGSRWSPGDNAIMAANMRDGIDPYKGTSRDQSLRGGAGGAGGAMDTERLMAMAQSPVGTPGRKAAMQMLQQHMQNQGAMDVARVGQETTLRSKEMEMQVAKARRDAVSRASQMSGNDPAKTAELLSNAGYTEDAKHFSEMANQTQTREKGSQELSTNARANTRREFQVMDSKDPSKVDQAASDQAFDAVRKIFPGIEDANEGVRNKFMPDAKAMHGIFQKAKTQDRVGWDAMKFWEPKRPQLSAMPDLRGIQGKDVEQVGPIGGLFTINAGNGDTLIKRKDGTTLNLGQLDAQQRELVDRATKQGWGK